MHCPRTRLRFSSVTLALASLSLLTTACENTADEGSKAKASSSSQEDIDGEEQAGDLHKLPDLEELKKHSSSSIRHDTFWKAFAYAEANPTAEPSDVNDWDCEPSLEHPRPVVLVHGTWVNQYDSWAKMAPVLAAEGWCLYSFNFGKKGFNLPPLKARYGTAALKESVVELKNFTQKVLDKTGSDQVDMVGWSQGGVLIRSYLKDHGGADPGEPKNNKVNRVVTLGSPHHGTTLSGIALLGNLLGITQGASGLLGQGPIDQAIGSEFLKDLNDGPDTMPGVTYTSIYTIYDQISNPVTNCLLKEAPGSKVHNVSIQDGCLIDFSEHLALPFTDRVIALTAQGLDPERQYRIPCKPQLGSM